MRQRFGFLFQMGAPLEAHVALPDRLRSAAVRRAPELFALQVVLIAQRPADVR